MTTKAQYWDKIIKTLEQKWTKKVYWADADGMGTGNRRKVARCCIEGAIGLVVPLNERIKGRYSNYIAKAIRPKHRMADMLVNIQFNDAKATTKRQVLSVVKKAKALALKDQKKAA